MSVKEFHLFEGREGLEVSMETLDSKTILWGDLVWKKSSGKLTKIAPEGTLIPFRLTKKLLTCGQKLYLIVADNEKKEEQEDEAYLLVECLKALKTSSEHQKSRDLAKAIKKAFFFHWKRPKALHIFAEGPLLFSDRLREEIIMVSERSERDAQELLLGTTFWFYADLFSGNYRSEALSAGIENLVALLRGNRPFTFTSTSSFSGQLLKFARLFASCHLESRSEELNFSHQCFYQTYDKALKKSSAERALFFFSEELSNEEL